MKTILVTAVIVAGYLLWRRPPSTDASLALHLAGHESPSLPEAPVPVTYLN